MAATEPKAIALLHGSAAVAALAAATSLRRRKSWSWAKAAPASSPPSTCPENPFPSLRIQGMRCPSENTQECLSVAGCGKGLGWSLEVVTKFWGTTRCASADFTQLRQSLRLCCGYGTAWVVIVAVKLTLEWSMDPWWFSTCWVYGIEHDRTISARLDHDSGCIILSGNDNTPAALTDPKRCIPARHVLSHHGFLCATQHVAQNVLLSVPKFRTMASGKLNPEEPTHKEPTHQSTTLDPARRLLLGWKVFRVYVELFSLRILLHQEMV